ncbi:hypothetical protein PQQ72_01280 [Paraburkholderia strydomiana]|uniref:hypothetical protein n=1 Tax=Paraburkholderia TaxID=1822464 RepID=UPI000B48F55E|nr:hypothetical protein BWU74_24805 [Burkholderia sp. Bk]
MSGTFNFASGELDAGSGLVLAPGRTTVPDLIAAGWKELDSGDDWESFSVCEMGVTPFIRGDGTLS